MDFIIKEVVDLIIIRLDTLLVNNSNFNVMGNMEAVKSLGFGLLSKIHTLFRDHLYYFVMVSKHLLE